MANSRCGSTNTQGGMKVSFTPNIGSTTTRTYSGAQSEMTALYSAYVESGWQCELAEGPQWTLTVSNPNDTGANEQPTLVYELLYEKNEKDLLNADLSIIKSLTLGEKEGLTAYLTQPSKYAKAGLDFPAGTTVTTNTLSVYALLRAGVKSVVQFSPVIRVSYLCSNSYVIQRNTANNGLILSTNSLISQEDVPDTLTPLLPNSGVATGLAYDFPPSAFGWLQYPPTVQQSAYNRINVAQEYHFGLWSTDIYGGLI